MEMLANQFANNFAHYTHKLCQLVTADGYSVLFAAACGFAALAAYHCRRCY